MQNRRKRIVDLAMKIGQAKQRRENIDREIAGMESELDSLLPPDEQDPDQGRRPVAKGGTTSGGLPARMLAVINSRPGEVFTAQEFESLGQKMQSVRSALSRMADGGQIKKLKRGHYQALGKKEGSR